MTLMSNQSNYEVDPHFNIKRKQKKRPVNQLYSESGGKDEGSVEVLQWVCEICEKETFNTFKEACQHEISCVQRSVNEKLKESEKSVKKRKKDSILNRKISTVCQPISTKTTNDTPVTDEVGSDLNMKWVCEWCNTAMFNTYAETVAHEKLCLQAHIDRNKQQLAAIEPKSSPSSKPLNHTTSSPVPTSFLPGPNSRPLMHERQMVANDIDMSKETTSIKNSSEANDANEQLKSGDNCETNETLDGENEEEEVEEVTHWVCEFCRVAVFDSYEKAAEHEATCKLAPQMEEAQPEVQRKDTVKPISDPKPLEEQKFDVESKPNTNGTHHVKVESDKSSEALQETKTNNTSDALLKSNNNNESAKNEENKTHVVRWVCEVCEIATFDTYVEACCHEIECRKKKGLLNKKTPLPDPVCSSHDKAKSPNQNEGNKAENVNGISNDKPNEIKDDSKLKDSKRNHKEIKVLSRPPSNSSDVKSDAVKRSNTRPLPTTETAQDIQNNINRLHQNPKSLSDITKALENGMSHPLRQMQGFGNPLSNKTNNLMNHGIPNQNYAARIPNDINEAINTNLLTGQRNPFVNPMSRVMQVPNFAGNTNPGDVGNIMNHIMQLQNQTNSHHRSPEMLLAAMNKLNAMSKGYNYDYNALNHLILNDSNRNINNLQAASQHLSHMSKINGNINTNASTSNGGNPEHPNRNALLFLKHFGLLDSSKNRVAAAHGAGGNNGNAMNLLAAGPRGPLSASRPLSNGMRSINGNYPNHNQINSFHPANAYNDNTNLAMLLQRHMSAVNHGKAIDVPNRIIENDESRTGLPQQNMVSKDQRNLGADKNKNNGHDIARITLPPIDKRSLLNSGSNSKELEDSTVKSDRKDEEGSKSPNGKKGVSKLNTVTTDKSDETTETYRWLCESCESQVFCTYQEAVAHEAICREAKKK